MVSQFLLSTPLSPFRLDRQGQIRSPWPCGLQDKLWSCCRTSAGRHQSGAPNAVPGARARFDGSGRRLGGKLFECLLFRCTKLLPCTFKMKLGDLEGHHLAQDRLVGHLSSAFSSLRAKKVKGGHLDKKNGRRPGNSRTAPPLRALDVTASLLKGTFANRLLSLLGIKPSSSWAKMFRTDNSGCSWSRESERPRWDDDEARR